MRKVAAKTSFRSFRTLTTFLCLAACDDARSRPPRSKTEVRRLLSRRCNAATKREAAAGSSGELTTVLARSRPASAAADALMKREVSSSCSCSYLRAVETTPGTRWGDREREREGERGRERERESDGPGPGPGRCLGEGCRLPHAAAAKRRETAPSALAIRPHLPFDLRGRHALLGLLDQLHRRGGALLELLEREVLERAAGRVALIEQRFGAAASAEQRLGAASDARGQRGPASHQDSGATGPQAPVGLRVGARVVPRVWRCVAECDSLSHMPTRVRTSYRTTGRSRSARVGRRRRRRSRRPSRARPCPTRPAATRRHTARAAAKGGCRGASCRAAAGCGTATTCSS